MIQKFWKQRCDFPGLWVLGTCLSSACYATLDRSLTEPLFKSFIELIYCFSPFHLCEDLKTKVHFWLLESWAHQAGSKDKAEKSLLSAGLVSGQTQSSEVEQGLDKSTCTSWIPGKFLSWFWGILFFHFVFINFFSDYKSNIYSVLRHLENSNTESPVSVYHWRQLWLIVWHRPFLCIQTRKHVYIFTYL